MFNQPGEILCQCFIVRSSRCGGAPLRARAKGLRDSSVAECVYTLAHAIGFVTRSLYAVLGRLSMPVTKEMIFEMKSEQLRMENDIFLFNRVFSLFIVVRRNLFGNLFRIYLNILIIRDV